MRVSYIYSQGWFGASRPHLDLGGLAELRHGMRDIFTSDAVIAHAPSLLASGQRDLIIKLRRNCPAEQVWLLESQESAVNYPDQFSPPFRTVFDGEISYRQSADVWAPYFTRWEIKDYGSAAITVRPELCCAFISSPFNMSSRFQYVDELMAHMPIASFGSFRRNRSIADDRGSETKLALLRDFSFTLAFENAIEVDYVTEKFFEPLIAGAVPVYLGAPNIGEFAPVEDCYVDASQFKTPAELARFLQTVDPARFHRWRQTPLRDTFLEKLERSSVSLSQQIVSLVGALRARKTKVPLPQAE